MKQGRKQGLNVDITPLIDVLFMLIIFFVLTAVFVQGSVPVDLPQGETPPAQERKPIVVTVTKDARIFWGGELIASSDLPRLTANAKVASDDILIAGDAGALYGAVAEVLDNLRNLGIESVGLLFGNDNPSP
ncbi:MAG: biopolymer transporter ExbD [Synergistaceae bacterium]|jgi:biopolymer transport protein ExbD|nr:biopolymer transporter ExbD [Synergistaceae bacterium]